jgi:CRP/FNR family transcriptional regulator, cyclic AMP receptor protein
MPALLRSLPDADAKRLLKASRVNNYKRRETLVNEGDPSDSFHIVLDGHVAVRLTKPSGETAIVNILGPDSHFGEVSLLNVNAGQRTATVVALEAVRTLSIPADVFHELRDRNPRMERLVTQILVQRVDELSGLLVEAMYDSLEVRVVRRVVRLAETYPTRNGHVTIPLTQDELAELVGGTRPSVNQVLRRLVDHGLLQVGRGRIIVKDIASLRRQAP